MPSVMVSALDKEARGIKNGVKNKTHENTNRILWFMKTLEVCTKTGMKMGVKNQDSIRCTNGMLVLWKLAGSGYFSVEPRHAGGLVLQHWGLHPAFW